MSNKGLKRLNYFNGQLLKEDDFKDEQDYNIKALAAHNKNLHSWGIASGLDIKYEKGKKYVTLEKGMAVDRKGRQIFLDDPAEIDVSKTSETIIFLTIFLKETKTDPAKEGDLRENTRICEEPDLKLNNSMPDENSNEIFLGKVILNPINKTVEDVYKEGRTLIGFSENIKTKSVAFIHPVNEEYWPRIKGTDGPDPRIDIISQNTIVSGNLEIKGKLKGKLEKKTVGIEHVKDNSISFSQIKHNKNVQLITGQINGKKKKDIAREQPDDISNKHLLFITSVIPTTPGEIKWWWQTELNNDQLTYVLMLENLSDITVSYEIKYYSISEI